MLGCHRIRRSEHESGFTLVELLVVLILLGIVGSIVTVAVTTTLRSAANTQVRSNALHEMETALQRVTRDLRTADPIRLLDTEEWSVADYEEEVVGNNGLGPFGEELGAEITRDGVNFSVIRYALVDGETGDDPQRLVRMDTGQSLVTLVDNEGTPVFTYLDAEGEPLTCGPPEQPDLEDCEDHLASAAKIRVTLVRVLGDRRPIQVDTVVNIRSIRYRG